MKKFFILILSAVFISNGVFAGEATINLRKKNVSNTAIRAALFPGWGQYFNGQKKKGRFVSTTAIVLSCASYYYYDKSEKTYSDYQFKGIKDDKLYSDYEKQHNMSRSITACVAGLWFCAFVDAVIVAYSDKKKSGRSVDLNFNGREFVFVKKF